MTAAVDPAQVQPGDIITYRQEGQGPEVSGTVSPAQINLGAPGVAAVWVHDHAKDQSVRVLWEHVTGHQPGGPR